jgi:hypothetical protein
LSRRADVEALINQIMEVLRLKSARMVKFIGADLTMGQFQFKDKIEVQVWEKTIIFAAIRVCAQ